MLPKEIKRASRRRPGERPPYMHRHELRRLLLMTALLGGLLAVFFNSDWLTAARLHRPDGGDVPSKRTVDSEEQARLDRLRAKWDEIRRAHGLPRAEQAASVSGNSKPKSVSSTPIPLDRGLLQWVEDNTEERERAPLSHLLSYVLSRSLEQLEHEVDRTLEPPRTGPQGVGVDRKHVEQLSAFVKAHRGAVMEIRGELLDAFPRVLEDPRYPVGLAEEAYILDDQKQVWVVIAATKEHDFKTRAGSTKGARVRAVGPLFKVLRVDTKDDDPKRRYKHYPVLVVRALEPAPPPEPGWSPTWWQIVALALALMAGGIVLGRLGYRTSNPAVGAGVRRKHVRLDNERLKEFDKKQRPTLQANAAQHPSASAGGEEAEEGLLAQGDGQQPSAESEEGSAELEARAVEVEGECGAAAESGRGSVAQEQPSDPEVNGSHG